MDTLKQIGILPMQNIKEVIFIKMFTIIFIEDTFSKKPKTYTFLRSFIIFTCPHTL